MIIYGIKAVQPFFKTVKTTLSNLICWRIKLGKWGGGDFSSLEGMWGILQCSRKFRTIQNLHPPSINWDIFVLGTLEYMSSM